MDIPGGTGRAKGWEQRAEVVSGAELDVEMMHLLIFSGGGELAVHQLDFTRYLRLIMVIWYGPEAVPV